MKRRTLQGGSIASFITFGVIIALVFIGSFYYLKIHGDQARKDQAIAQSEKEKAAEKTAQNQNQSSSNNSEETNPNNQVSESTDTSSAAAIPTTGPELAIGELVGAGALAVSVTSFALSRRRLARYL